MYNYTPMTLFQNCFYYSIIIITSTAVIFMIYDNMIETKNFMLYFDDLFNRPAYFIVTVVNTCSGGIFNAHRLSINEGK